MLCLEKTSVCVRARVRTRVPVQHWLDSLLEPLPIAPNRTVLAERPPEWHGHLRISSQTENFNLIFSKHVWSWTLIWIWKVRLGKLVRQAQDDFMDHSLVVFIHFVWRDEWMEFVTIFFVVSGKSSSSTSLVFQIVKIFWSVRKTAQSTEVFSKFWSDHPRF